MKGDFDMKRKMEDVVEDMWSLYYYGDSPEDDHMEADNLLLEALEIAAEEGIENHQASALKVAFEGIGKWYC